jgi:hypothetical protein
MNISIQKSTYDIDTHVRALIGLENIEDHGSKIIINGVIHYTFSSIVEAIQMIFRTN